VTWCPSNVEVWYDSRCWNSTKPLTETRADVTFCLAVEDSSQIDDPCEYVRTEIQFQYDLNGTHRNLLVETDEKRRSYIAATASFEVGS
jgi:hypothetical protein